MRTLVYTQIFLNSQSLFALAVYIQFLLTVAPMLQAQELDSSSTQVENADPNDESPSSFLNNPGLGTANFSTNELQEQLDSVRQFSASPLHLDPPANRNLKPNVTEPSRESAVSGLGQLDQPKMSPDHTVSSAEQNITTGNTNSQPTGDDAQVRFAPRSYLPVPEQNQSPQPAAIPTTATLEQEEITVQTADSSPDTSTAKDPPSTPTWRSPSLASSPFDQLQYGTSEKQTNISKTVPLGEPFQLSLHGLIWTYIPGLSQYPKEPPFDRELGNLETTFRFQFPKVGRYLLTFSRQFPSTGELEYYNAEIIVEKSSGTTMASSKPYPAQTAVKPVLAPLQTPKVIAEPMLQLSSASQSLPSTSKGVNLRITSQVISDLRKLLENGELNSVYETLNSWPAGERGDIYNTAAEYFRKANMNSKAVDMWKRNVSLEGDLGSKAIRGIVDALAEEQNIQELLQWLPPFLEQAKNQQNSPYQEPMIQTDDFAKLYSSISQVDIPTLDSQDINSGSIIEFYQVYLNLFPDNNSPEILYKMGMLYEKLGKYQNLRQARQLYRNIQNGYPVSQYSERANKRLNFLNRQFFVVQ